MMSFKGWGIKARASFSTASEDVYKNNQVRFMGYRNLVYGFSGYSAPPPLSDKAKQLLIKKGTQAFAT